MKAQKRKLNILYIITKSNWGGAQRYVFDLAVSLQNAHIVTVATGGSGKENAQGGLLKEKLDGLGIHTIFIENFMRDISLMKEMGAFFELLSLIKKNKPDVVHLNSSKAGGLGVLAARLNGTKKIIFTVHGWAFNEDRPFFVRLMIWILSWFTALLATDVIVVGTKEYAQGKKMPLIKKKLHLIHHGITIDDSLDLTKEDARRKLLNITQPPVWIGTIAELHKNKGLEYLIKAGAKLPENILICIIGEGNEREKLEALIEEVGVSKKVQFLSFVDNAALYLKAFDIFVLPSIKEGLPYVLLEAGARGLPVIASDVGDIRDIISDEKYGIVIQPKDVEGLTSAINNLLLNGSKKIELGSNLQKRIREEFQTKKMISDTLSLYLL